MTKKKAKEKGKDSTENNSLTPRDELRQAVRFMYDLQKLRIQTGNRVSASEREAEEAAIELSEEQVAQMKRRSDALQELEKDEERVVKGMLKNFPISKWLLEQKGCGTKMSGMIISEFDIHKAGTPSAFWSFAGLAVRDGKAPRKTKGEKLPYNSYLRSKLVGKDTLADCLIKANGPSAKNPQIWYELYANEKHRRESMRVDVCMACEGKKKVVDKETKKKRKCKNCGGTGGPAPWGMSQMHRHNVAKRKMIKMFLLDLWKEWRRLEGLKVVAPYSEAKLGLVHGEHATLPPRPGPTSYPESSHRVQDTHVT